MKLFDLISLMAFSILPTTANDLPIILEMNDAALPAVSSVNLNEMTHFLNIADYFNTLKINNEIAGFLIALTPGKDYHSLNYKWFENKFNSFMYVDRIVITPEFQGRGFGHSFYQNLSKVTVGKEPRIACEVNIRPMNKVSILFHEKYGFRQVGTQKTEGGKKEVSLMTLPL